LWSIDQLDFGAKRKPCTHLNPNDVLQGDTVIGGKAERFLDDNEFSW
jgi:hypothetical protein